MGQPQTRTVYVEKPAEIQTVYVEKPPPCPPPEFDHPWRKMRWEDKEKIEQNLREFKLKHPDVHFVRILIVGAVGAGKSSFINSVNNAFQKRITSEALTATGSTTSFTQRYETYHINGEDGSPLPFVFNDVMGLEIGEHGADAQDMIRALQGFLEEGYNFQRSSTVSKDNPGFRSNPSLEDKTYCLVFVMDANTVSQMEQAHIEKMKIIREAAAKLKMPQVVIMTKPDLACQLVHQDLTKIYTSKKIKEKMQECSNLLGVTMNHIFPVKNYHEEIDTENDMDILILKALDQIVNIACDALKKTSLISGVKPE